MRSNSLPIWKINYESPSQIELSTRSRSVMSSNQHHDDTPPNFHPLSDVTEHDYENVDNNAITDAASQQYGDQDQNDDHIFSYSNGVRSIHRNKTFNPKVNKLTHYYESRTNGRTMGRNRRPGVGGDFIEDHANLIVAKMEQDPALMKDSAMSEELRREALRDMPQCLTLKRCVKVKLLKSVSQKSKRKPLGCWKRLKYQMNFFISRQKMNIKNIIHSSELWYGALKQIEGNFGSGVGSFFKFLRWIFVMNLLVAIGSVLFIIFPQFFFDTRSSTSATTFKFGDIFTGEEYLENTFLFYGFYSNRSVNVLSLTYSMPDAYFFTMACIYFGCFSVLSISVARSYRRSFIETEGGLKNVYAHKLFCGWDYSIATKDASQLKSHAIYTELKELLYESIRRNKKSWRERVCVRTKQFMLHILVIMLLSCIGYLVSFFKQQMDEEHWSPIYTALAVNIIMTIFPLIFGWISKYEGYTTPRSKIYLTLVRTFALGIMIISIIMTFLLKHVEDTCWESHIGQELYRLILFDFLFSITISPLLDLATYWYCRIFKKGHLHFDISYYTMQIIFSQNLFWVGMFFSPPLAVIVTVKLFILWYVRQLTVLKLCKPSSKSWRAAQMQTWFLVMVFLSIITTAGFFGFLACYIPTSSCGPFSDYEYIYEFVILGVLNLKKNSNFFRLSLFVTKPGFIALVLIALCGRAYHLRAKAHAQREIVAIYKDMLIWESRDKEFLLQNISLVTKGQWQYNLQEGREFNPIIQSPVVGKYVGSEGDIAKDPYSRESLVPSASSSSTDPSSSNSQPELLGSHLYSEYKKYS